MRVTNIALDKDGEPEAITAVMSHTESVFLGKLLGGMNGVQYADVMPLGDHVGSDIYEALSSLFCRFYEDGIDGAL